MKILIVRLGALGDIVHTIPAAAALRAAMPDASIDWIVDAKHRELADLVTVVDRVLALEGPTPRAWIAAVRQLRTAGYDAALDFQGLMMSAVLARASGARRVAGFSIWHLREKTARPFYSETDDAMSGEEHVLRKNLSLLRVLGIEATSVQFPLERTSSSTVETVRGAVGPGDFALINPGAAWPNKRWPADRFGELAAFLREICDMRSVVLWGPGEQELARGVVSASSGAAIVAPPTRLSDILELAREASLMVSGDTGPLHLAAAVQTPIVAIMGPSNPHRNGPWAADDVTVSRFESCGCHYERRCHQPTWCLADVSVSEVSAAVQRRLGTRVADSRVSIIGDQPRRRADAPGADGK
jgi:lipopolysaccharide heptosyltransferase I